MSSTFNQRMRDKLVTLRTELESAATTSDEASQVVVLDQSTVGRLSRIDAMQVQAMAQASGRRREANLRLIEAALDRIRKDEFGLCRSCGEPINQKRLEFDPTALLCIDCAKSSEQRANR